MENGLNEKWLNKWEVVKIKSGWNKVVKIKCGKN